MNTYDQNQNSNINIKNLYLILKKNLGYVLFCLFSFYYFYLIHLDSLEHASERGISISQAWDDLKSNKFMSELLNASNAAREIQ